MKGIAVAAVMAALSTAAVAQDQPSAWQLFDAAGGMSGAGLKGTGGTLIVKCDRPGKKEVYAMIMTDERIAASYQNPEARPIKTQFDGKSPSASSWNFHEKYATALGKTADRTLSRFIIELRKASKVDMRLNTGIGADVIMGFVTTGAKGAIDHVYQACKDDQPV